VRWVGAKLVGKKMVFLILNYKFLMLNYEWVVWSRASLREQNLWVITLKLANL
jgi:hypothetical protein